MAFGKRIHCWLLLSVFLCLVGCMEATKRAPRAALLVDSQLQNANRKGTSIQGTGIVKSESVLSEEAEMAEEGRILLAEGNGLMGNTFDYPPSGPNHDHDSRHPHGNENGTKMNN